MSRSEPPRSSTAGSLPHADAPAPGPSGRSKAYRRPLRRRLAIRFAALMRWLHIYVSMFGMAAVLFFSVTGITLNHPDWFFGESDRREQAEGTVDAKWLHLDARDGSTDPEAPPDLERQVARLEVVEHLRKTHGIRGALAEFKVDDTECLVTFKGPGYAADAFIDRDTGRYTVTQSFHGFIAVINDLHKGRDSGPVWSAVIDVSAVVLTLISLTGLVLLFYLKLRRIPGVVVAVVGTIIVALLYWLGVP